MLRLFAVGQTGDGDETGKGNFRPIESLPATPKDDADVISAIFQVGIGAEIRRLDRRRKTSAAGFTRVAIVVAIRVGVFSSGVGPGGENTLGENCQKNNQ